MSNACVNEKNTNTQHNCVGASYGPWNNFFWWFSKKLSRKRKILFLREMNPYKPREALYCTVFILNESRGDISKQCHSSIVAVTSQWHPSAAQQTASKQDWNEWNVLSKSAQQKHHWEMRAAEYGGKLADAQNSHLLAALVQANWRGIDGATGTGDCGCFTRTQSWWFQVPKNTHWAQVRGNRKTRFR